MEITLPADLRTQLERELARGCYLDVDQLIAEAVRHFFDDRQRGEERLRALQRVGQAVDQAGLYEKVLVPRLE